MRFVHSRQYVLKLHDAAWGFWNCIKIRTEDCGGTCGIFATVNSKEAAWEYAEHIEDFN